MTGFTIQGFTHDLTFLTFGKGHKKWFSRALFWVSKISNFLKFTNRFGMTFFFRKQKDKKNNSEKSLNSLKQTNWHVNFLFFEITLIAFKRWCSFTVLKNTHCFFFLFWKNLHVTKGINHTRDVFKSQVLGHQNKTLNRAIYTVTVACTS